MLLMISGLQGAAVTPSFFVVSLAGEFAGNDGCHISSVASRTWGTSLRSLDGTHLTGAAQANDTSCAPYCRNFACSSLSISSARSPTLSTRDVLTITQASNVAEAISFATDAKSTVQAAACEAVTLATAAVKASREAVHIAELQNSERKKSFANPCSQSYILLDSAFTGDEFRDADCEQSRNVDFEKMQISARVKQSGAEMGSGGSCLHQIAHINGQPNNLQISVNNDSLSEHEIDANTSLGQARGDADRAFTSNKIWFRPSIAYESSKVMRSKRRSQRSQRRANALLVSQEQIKVRKTLTSVKRISLANRRSSMDSQRTCHGPGPKSKLLTAEEEVELSKSIQDLLMLESVKEQLKEQLGRVPSPPEWAGAVGMDVLSFEQRLRRGMMSRDEMITKNVRLVISVAKKHLNRGVDLYDLVQEGTIGLRKATERFDHTKGFKFSTYAHWWIRQAVNRCISDHSRTVRLPVHMYETLNRINKAQWMLLEENGKIATNKEVAAVTNMCPGRVHAALKVALPPKSMDFPLGPNGDFKLGDSVQDQNAVDPFEWANQQLLKRDIQNALHTLSPRERDVMRLRFGIDISRQFTLSEIGSLFCVTRERVRQIENTAMGKLRQPDRSSSLQHYVNMA